MGIARQARSDAGLDPTAVAFGSYVNVGCLANRADARSLVRGGLSTFARFAIMHGEVVGPVSSDQADVMQRLHESYDMRSHTQADSAQALLLSDDFVDSYAIVGSPDECLERIAALSDLGLDKLVVVSATAGSDKDLATQATNLLASEVLGKL
jgi:5,10-methylenetetrahydromethanopterin reductase